MDELTDVGVSVNTEAKPSLLGKIKANIRFLNKYKDNLKTLEAAKSQLDVKRTNASRFSGDSNHDSEDIITGPSATREEKLCKDAKDILSRKNVPFLNMRSRYLLSKRAWELTQEINAKVETTSDFGTTYDRPVPELGAKLHMRGYTEFESRLRVLNGVLEALKDEAVSMCSICGMGGTGKTMLAERLIQRVEADRLFDNVVMVTVSQNPNFERIQEDIAKSLGLEFHEESLWYRARKLHYRLSNSNNTLLILDDVWWQLSEEVIEKVGIPSGSKRCKIVVTSRDEVVCRLMGRQRNFVVGVLEEEEAWDLFRLRAGKCVEELNLEDNARKIVDECGGLPIAIVTIAAALRDKPKVVWEDALRQLQNSNLQSFEEMKQVYSQFQLSYDLLNHEEARSCFRLFCLFPEDSDVSAEQLAIYMKGLGLLKDADDIYQARDRVYNLIDELKRSFLVLDGQEDECFKMHDLIRDSHCHSPLIHF